MGMETNLNTTLVNELLQMAEVDQAMRMKAIEDETLWDVSVDETNNARLAAIIEQDGWPTIPKVGEEASHAAWLLVQHAPSLDFMKSCLQMMKDAPLYAVKASNIAYLEDRVLMMDGKPQIYGTQYRTVGEGMKVYLMENPDEVNLRRASVGLGTFEDDKARLIELYHKPVID